MSLPAVPPVHHDRYHLELGDYHCEITTTNPETQKWFNAGLIWCFGFNHEEAVSCFSLAMAQDPGRAMPYWGAAYAHGPNYNKPWEAFDQQTWDEEAKEAHEHTRNAKMRAEDATPVERALVNALCSRHPEPRAPETTEEGTAWNKAYAAEMQRVYDQFPDHLDVTFLYADALMNVKPWNLWDIRSGLPVEGASTLEIKRVLDRALSLPGGERHPGILHLYIHLMEMSPEPETALPAANRLRGLVPGAGHLNHMPSHIDILVGDYASAVEANHAAMASDMMFFSHKMGEPGSDFYTLYRCHNLHFLLYAAMFSGQSTMALDAVDRLEDTISEELLRSEDLPMADLLESFLAMRVHALIRFGRWKEVITIQFPHDEDLYCTTTAMLCYAKAIALAAIGKVQEAQRFQKQFRLVMGKVKPTRMLFNNKCTDILRVAEALLDGEIEYRRGNYAEAFQHLRESIYRYDTLPYDEPWGWMQPARHAYGALLLEQGHVKEAMAVYAEDLGYDKDIPRPHHHPNNVWALHGYHECLVRLGHDEQAREMKPQLEAALQRADVPISSSCFCRNGEVKIDSTSSTCSKSHCPAT